ncbi:DNA polymerase IV [Legionella anisa]|uniref:DNA polymerase IV n=1 Tax=Legionella anisa TaxID=28082 RepID=A0AAX0WS26_9GAMM|nr:DNA polymerase IV [Legionella anisa]AWN74905.1 DNA polymerase IV [Legionella anisa]KTC67381.1 DNA polymerase IV [Legionella anisa]MBN5937658.1 DNA polymerase IV [Legionella anisa]MCW8424892.1 DNA polymerase IV [Legionella anisa]MCW8445988.1 DNA polymerase IV [Legionella anisa]
MPNHLNENILAPRKIIHIDMDCFYAAIEIRDNPSLNNKPVAVGGSANQRGVLCTCNYVARGYGVHSAMPTAVAQRLCPDLIVLPVNMSKYKTVSQSINSIFRQFTDLVEPLSLDEAFLDVTHAPHCHNSATLMAQAIREIIFREHQLTASAGVAPNKFLAKIASAWNKPNGLFVITPEQVDHFIKTLPINKLFGVGKVTAAKLNQLNIFTCNDLHQYPLDFLIKHFGKFGQQLFYQAQGIDNRPVQPHRLRKSLSVEKTLQHNIHDSNEAIKIINELYKALSIRIQESAADLLIKNQFIKIKMSDFKLVSAEIKSAQINLECYQELFQKINRNPLKPIRLLGIGVHFAHPSTEAIYYQPPLFEIEE